MTNKILCNTANSILTELESGKSHGDDRIDSENQDREGMSSNIEQQLPDQSRVSQAVLNPDTSNDLNPASTLASHIGKKRRRLPPPENSGKKQRHSVDPESINEEDSEGLDEIPANPEAVQAARQRDRDVETAFAQASEDPENSTLTIQTGSRSETMTFARTFQIVYNLQPATQSESSITADGGSEQAPAGNERPAAQPDRRAAVGIPAIAASAGRASTITRAATRRSATQFNVSTADEAAEHDHSTSAAPVNLPTTRVTRSSAKSATIGHSAPSTNAPAMSASATSTSADSVSSSTNHGPASQTANQAAAQVPISQGSVQATVQTPTNNQIPPSILDANPQLMVNQPRAAGVTLPTDATHTTTVWEAYPGTVDWTNLVSVTKLNRWRNQKIRRRTNRFGTKTDGRTG